MMYYPRILAQNITASVLASPGRCFTRAAKPLAALRGWDVPASCPSLPVPLELRAMTLHGSCPGPGVAFGPQEDAGLCWGWSPRGGQLALLPLSILSSISGLRRVGADGPGTPRKDAEEGEWLCPTGGEVFSSWPVTLLTPTGVWSGHWHLGPHALGGSPSCRAPRERLTPCANPGRGGDGANASLTERSVVGWLLERLGSAVGSGSSGLLT